MRKNYIHVRFWNYKWNEVHTKGGYTIAWAVDETIDSMLFGIAKCHLTDNYCKATGRSLAANRMTIVVPMEMMRQMYGHGFDDLPPNSNGHLAHQYVSDLMENGQLPDRAFFGKEEVPSGLISKLRSLCLFDL